MWVDDSKYSDEKRSRLMDKVFMPGLDCDFVRVVEGLGGNQYPSPNNELDS